MSRLALVAALALTAVLTAPTFSRAQTTGWIESFSGLPSEYVLLRGNSPIQVAVFLPLREGDQIRVLQEGRTIRLALDGGARVVTLSSGTQLEVTTGSRSMPTVPTNLLSWAGSWLTIRHQESLSTVNVLVRSRRLTLPLLDRGPQAVLGPLRQIAMAWEGGLPPYHVVLSHRHAPEKPLVETQAASSRVLLTGLELLPGEYTLRIADSQLNAASARFLVSGDSTSPGELVDSALPYNLRHTLLATWLAAPPNGQQILQAYQLVAPIADTYYPAALLRDALERGDVPSLPK